MSRDQPAAKMSRLLGASSASEEKKNPEILFESLGVVAYRRLAYSIRGLTGIRALECDP